MAGYPILALRATHSHVLVVERFRTVLTIVAGCWLQCTQRRPESVHGGRHARITELCSHLRSHPAVLSDAVLPGAWFGPWWLMAQDYVVVRGGLLMRTALHDL